MTDDEILNAIDEEIDRLQKVRDLLTPFSENMRPQPTTMSSEKRTGRKKVVVSASKAALNRG